MRAPLRPAADTLLLCVLAGPAQSQVAQPLRPGQAAFREIDAEFALNEGGLVRGEIAKNIQIEAAR